MPVCARGRGFDVIRTVEAPRSAARTHQDADEPLDPRLRRQRPGRARETDIGLTGGGNGKHMVYLSGI